MKKALAVTLGLAVFSLGGCGSEEAEKAKEPAEEVTEKVEEKDEEKKAEPVEETDGNTAEEQVEDTEEEEPAEVVAPDYIVVNYGFGDLLANLNIINKELGLGYSLDYSRDGNIVKISITDTGSVVIGAESNEDDNSFKSLSVVGAGFTEDVEFLDFILATGMVIAVTNSSLLADERGNILSEKLNMSSLLEQGGGSNSTVVGDTKYRLSVTSQGLMMFTATHKDDPVNE